MVFVQRHNNDPAVNVSFPTTTTVDTNSTSQNIQNFILKLKAHLLPRIRAVHGIELIMDSSTATTHNDISDPMIPNQVVPRQNRFYRHNLMQINYTAYNVRHAQDVVNPNTEHCDIMMLSRSSSHPFCYARVIGIFHANIICTGPGLLDYQPWRLEFLWVRWFELIE